MVYWVLCQVSAKEEEIVKFKKLDIGKFPISRFKRSEKRWQRSTRKLLNISSESLHMRMQILG